MASLHTEYISQQADNKITAADRKVWEYIEKYPNAESFDEYLAEEDDWEVFYQLSDLRTGLISWYDFRPGANVLEVGAGFGALTGKLCGKCTHVTATEKSLYRAQGMAKRYATVDNLTIYAGDISQIPLREKYDYIVVVGLLERMGDHQKQYLQQLKGLLTAKGRLLLAVTNRFGLKYFCGARDPYTRKAFGGINQYDRYTKGAHALSRQELQSLIREAGYADARFFYPLPDDRLPQLIYTDEYLPEQNLKERLIPYYPKKDTLVANEAGLYDDVITNGVFPFMANAFFVECTAGQSDRQNEVLYAAVSTDRGRERSFATVIGRDTVTNERKVRKTPLYPAGVQNAKDLYENICDLKAHGIPVVEHKMLADGSLEQPFIQWPTLSNYIKEKISDTAKFLQLIDRLYANILQSSEQLPEEENVLRKYGENLEFGPILSKAYIELIPLNCFIDPNTEAFLYFDQEFVRRAYPAKYVLFRAIHYIYAFTPGAEKYYTKQKLIDDYGMTDTWKIYEEEEACFLEEVRNHKRYAQFYRWAGVDWKRMTGNARRLESDEERIANYQVSDAMKKIWDAELGMLREVDRICKENGLTYYLVHGTLLGAVRHKGFIPWDDDLDIAMPRDSYDQFLKIALKQLKEPLSLHTPETETEMFWGGYARVRNAQTTGVEVRDLGQKGNKGIWIDILPLDICTGDEEKLRRKEQKIHTLQRLLYAKRYGHNNEKFMDMTPGIWKWYRFRAALHSEAGLCKKLDRAIRSFTGEEDNCGEVATFTGYGKVRRLSATDFAETTLLEFEGGKYPVPKGYENYLFELMGRDYLKYPPEEERKPKHRGVFDATVPYTVYEEKLNGLFRSSEGRKIILFGAGLMFEDYMKKYGGKYRPEFVVDNDSNKWGRIRQGIEIRNPEEILKIPENKRLVIICSYYYDEIEKQLQNMNVRDYRIYVQNADWIVERQKKGMS